MVTSPLIKQVFGDVTQKGFLERVTHLVVFALFFPITLPLWSFSAIFYTTKVMTEVDRYRNYGKGSSWTAEIYSKAQSLKKNNLITLLVGLLFGILLISGISIGFLIFNGWTWLWVFAVIAPALIRLYIIGAVCSSIVHFRGLEDALSPHLWKKTLGRVISLVFFVSSIVSGVFLGSFVFLLVCLVIS